MMTSSNTNAILIATIAGLAVFALSLPLPVANNAVQPWFEDNNNTTTNFNCTGDICQACVNFDLVGKNWNLCTDLGYQPDNGKYLIQFELNGNVLYHIEVPSFASDPRLCTPIPFIIVLEMVCIDFSGYYVDTNGTAHSCAFLTGAGFFTGRKDFNITLGCMALPHTGNTTTQLLV